MVGIQNDDIVLTPFQHATKTHHALNPTLLRLVEILSL
jgi:hypothetical protein